MKRELLEELGIEIEEALWIDTNYEKVGIVCNPTLKFKIIPDLMKDNYLKM